MPDTETELFDISAGVLQGDVPAPLIFTLSSTMFWACPLTH